MLYIQLAAFPLLAAGGIWAGWRMARRRFWWVGVVLAMLVLGVVLVGHRSQRLRFVPVVAWAVDAEWNPLLMTAAISVMFATLMPKLPQRRTRVFVGAAMGAMLLYNGLMPAVLPLAVRGSLAGTATVMDHHGVCLQQHAYSCGPAAAVTCLRKLGVRAEEGPLAMEARCGPAVGTDGAALAAAVERSAPGVTCTYRYVSTLEDLRVPAVADMMIPPVGGHFVAVLEVRPDGVLVGDPLSGLGVVSRDEFMAEWRHGAIEMATSSRTSWSPASLP